MSTPIKRKNVFKHGFLEPHRTKSEIEELIELHLTIPEMKKLISIKNTDVESKINTLRIIMNEILSFLEQKDLQSNDLKQQVDKLSNRVSLFLEATKLLGSELEKPQK